MEINNLFYKNHGEIKTFMLTAAGARTTCAKSERAPCYPRLTKGSANACIT